jgi:hypothetical protein
VERHCRNAQICCCVSLFFKAPLIFHKHFFRYFNVRCMHLVQFIILNQPYTTYILVIFHLLSALLHVALHLRHLQGVLTLYFAKVSKLLKLQYSETNVTHFLFSLLRIKGVYMFRALLVHPQEALHKPHLVYCVCVMSVGCYQGWSGTPFHSDVTHTQYTKCRLCSIS